MPEHVFVAASCIWCGADDHDVDLPEQCPVEREPMSYTTETGRTPTSNYDDPVDYS